MKKVISLFLIISLTLLIIGCGSDKSLPNENESAISESKHIENDPNLTRLIFAENGLDSQQSINDAPYVIATFSDNKYVPIDQYLFNDNSISYYIGKDPEKVYTDVIDSGDQMSFYDTKGEKINATCLQAFCFGEVIQDQADLRLEISPDKKGDKRYIGIDHSIQPYPRKVTYGNDCIIADFDGDGKKDDISWSFTQNEPSNAAKEVSVTAYIQIGDISQTITCDSLSAREEFDLFVADVDNDNQFEFIIYEKNIAKSSSLTVYKIFDKSVDKLFTYVFSVGP